MMRCPELRAAGLAGFGFLSINRYNAVCLNANSVMFADIDCVPSQEAPHKAVTPWEDAVKLVAGVAQATGLAFRIYRTHSGLRLVEISRLHTPDAEETIEVLKSLQCDSAFVALTRQLKNFRVRLTPKPWRTADGTFPFDFENDPDAAEAYLKSSDYAVAIYLGTMGHVPEQPNLQILTIVNLHDEYCCRAGALA